MVPNPFVSKTLRRAYTLYNRTLLTCIDDGAEQFILQCAYQHDRYPDATIQYYYKHGYDNQAKQVAKEKRNG